MMSRNLQACKRCLGTTPKWRETSRIIKGISRDNLPDPHFPQIGAIDLMEQEITQSL